MKTSRKYIAALAVFAAGSIFFGSLPAQAKAIESKVVQAAHRHGPLPPPPPPEFRRHHGRNVPPPPPEHHRHHGYVPLPEHRRHHGHNVPPPPPEHCRPHHHRHRPHRW